MPPAGDGIGRTTGGFRGAGMLPPAPASVRRRPGALDIPGRRTMAPPPAWQQTFDFFPRVPIVVEPSEARLSSDAGLLPVRQFDERIGLTRSFTGALDDPRDPDLT